MGQPLRRISLPDGAICSDGGARRPRRNTWYDADQLDRFAERLAACGFSLSELDRIVYREVCGTHKTAVVDEVLAISTERGLPAGRIAIAWVLAKGLLPIIGPRTPEHLDDDLASAAVTLSREQMQRLDAVSAITLGFPHDVVAGSSHSLSGGMAEQIDRPARALR